MTEERDFLAAICAQPDDDTLRLVFADWLDEHEQGDRAAFIRLQIRLQRADLDDPELSSFDAQAWELFKQHRDEWLVGFPPELADAVHYDNFERGLLSRLDEGSTILPKLP